MGLATDAGPRDRRGRPARDACSCAASSASSRRSSTCASSGSARSAPRSATYFLEHLRRRRLLPLHRAVPAARPRAVADRGGALVASVGDRLHRRLRRRAEDHPSLPPVGDHGRRAWPIAAVGTAMLLGLGLDGGAGIAIIVVASIVISLGLAPVITLATELIVGSAPPEQAGAATGMSETSGELGGALGIAILGSIGTAVYRTEIADSLPPGIPAEVVGRGAGHARRRARDRSDAPRGARGGARRRGPDRVRRRAPFRRRGGHARCDRDGDRRCLRPSERPRPG